MHELAIADEIVQLALEHSEGARIHAIILEIGDLAGVEPEALAFCFETLIPGTRAADSRLEIRRIPGQARCRACTITYDLARLHDPCPGCGAYERDILQGKQMGVKELEVE